MSSPDSTPDTPDDGAALSGEAPSGAELARRALAEARAAARERGAAPGRPARRVSRGANRSHGQPQMFGEAVRAWLIERGWQDQVAIGGVFGRWEQIVGERLAAHARPDSVEDGELVVAVDSPTWATQVRALAPELLRRINAELGQGAVKSIKVRGPGRYRPRPGRRG